MAGDWYPTIGGQECSSPRVVVRGDQGFNARNWPELLNRANSYNCPLGPDPGEAVLVLRRSQFDVLDPDAAHDLIFRSSFGNVTIKDLTFVKDMSLFGLRQDPKSPMLCTLADVRVKMRRSTINTTYNVRMPAPSSTATTVNQYYAESLNSGALWTWQTVVNDIWALLTIAPGSAPTLPSTPTSVPENLVFAAGHPLCVTHNAWDALHHVLSLIEMTTAYDPLAKTFSVVERSAVQLGLVTAHASLANRLRQDMDPDDTLNAGNMPATVVVYFKKRWRWAGIEDDTSRTGNYEMDTTHSESVSTGVSGAVGTVSLFDPLDALVQYDGTVTNTSELNARATELAGWIAGNTPRRRKHIYAGPTSTILPGSEISRVVWRDYQDRDGLVTEAWNARSDEPWFGMKGDDGCGRPLPHWPRETQFVAVTGESAEGTFGATTITVHPAQVRLWRNGVEVLDECWLSVANAWDANSGDVALTVDELYMGRLYGTAVSGGVERPLYLTRTFPDLDTTSPCDPFAVLVGGVQKLVGTKIVMPAILLEFDGRCWSRNTREDLASEIDICDIDCASSASTTDPTDPGEPCGDMCGATWDGNEMTAGDTECDGQTIVARHATASNIFHYTEPDGDIRYLFMVDNAECAGAKDVYTAHCNGGAYTEDNLGCCDTVLVAEGDGTFLAGPDADYIYESCGSGSLEPCIEKTLSTVYVDGVPLTYGAWSGGAILPCGDDLGSLDNGITDPSDGWYGSAPSGADTIHHWFYSRDDTGTARACAGGSPPQAFLLFSQTLDSEEACVNTDANTICCGDAGVEGVDPVVLNFGFAVVTETV